MRARAIEPKGLMANIVYFAAGPIFAVGAGSPANRELAADMRPAREEDAVRRVRVRVLLDLLVVKELERSEYKIGVEDIPRR